MMRPVIFLVAATSLVGACKWTEFDDLADQAWVDSTTRPGNVKSDQYALAITRGALAGATGGKLVVIGNGEPTYSEIVYSAQGEASSPSTVVDLKTAYGIQTIADHPLVIADPTSDDISFIVGSDNGFAVLTGNSGTLKLYQLFNQPAPQPDAATFVLAAPQTRPMPLVGVGSMVEGVVLPALPTGAAQPTCTLLDASMPGATAQIRALGAVAGAGDDKLVMWDASGRIYRYPGSVFNGCAAPGADREASTSLPFTPDTGSQILRAGNAVVLAGHHGGDGVLQLLDPVAMAPLGASVSVPGLASADLLLTDTAGNGFVVAGVPTAQVDGKPVGEVQLFPLSPTGIAATPVATYHDAQPEADQQFGRGVAVMKFNGASVIAVAAKNEVFTYFRANLGDGTALYPETRQDH
ncbi:MAG TPA: hypothetical protein VFP84_10065 [Kofleriaceae bacterium]|nr:hypothetical protein [Kofleriaceae bacterium]